MVRKTYSWCHLVSDHQETRSHAAAERLFKGHASETPDGRSGWQDGCVCEAAPDLEKQQHLEKFNRCGEIIKSSLEVYKAITATKSRIMFI